MTQSRSTLKIAIIGSGNWATAISTVVGYNATRYLFLKDEISQWVYEEIIEGQKLSEIINTTHENKKYLPGVKLPINVRAVPDLVETASGADLLIFVLPHQFLIGVLHQLEGKLKPGARAISLIKGFHVDKGRPILFTEIISKTLNIECCILSGANVATNVARGEFCETTLGYSNIEGAELWQRVFDTPVFKVNPIPDICGVELCGTLKNVIALAAGFCDGLGLGTNTKAALIRLGVNEMKQFGVLFFHVVYEETFLDSAGYPDVITSCFGGRNVRCAAEFVKRRSPSSVSDPEADEVLWRELEKELLNEQKLQGTLTTKDVYHILEESKLFAEFPLFTTTHHIAFKGLPADRIVTSFMTEDMRSIKLIEHCRPCTATDSIQTLKKSLVASPQTLPVAKL